MFSILFDLYHSYLPLKIMPIAWLRNNLFDMYIVNGISFLVYHLLISSYMPLLMLNYQYLIILVVIIYFMTSDTKNSAVTKVEFRRTIYPINSYA